MIHDWMMMYSYKTCKKRNLEAIELKIENEKYLKIFKKYLENTRNFKQY